ncbi:Cellular nucleic acid-binding protein [Carex littledalei]|uniref:Cellular nucleic acid-binding protein n=1 Tax=Carex littledalei TaxID=544730 RepID=A0A833V441_9POAL|nr:Cellular nucleic acid-binding protein [Carex littledalei]
MLIRRKVVEIRSKSTADNPWCLRCGSKGHTARACRNAQLCFVCNRFGHRASSCSIISSILPRVPHSKRSRNFELETLPLPKPRSTFPIRAGTLAKLAL